ncbi:heterokaryon incompatibility protein-domain-containing protein [Microdochium trichocladiopsis]|uniref:Heterokaryon incompatibility protein-domain-containing protein n=1 Tax=Microdochium trichocladiopsis TaxID=1682393 RepID=A0A9P8XYE6_9PEZI|nr:heterokaryon incompatibility protein-domain-containing protein [Microdochium trichocladiopsis]KAH7025081.1 heterokaryon incompatibility protein-domain-containing protein [Microdochium trichocladiopsis]
MSELYSGLQLEPSRAEIRLLRLKAVAVPGSIGAHDTTPEPLKESPLLLECSMEVFKLDSYPSFAALSYVWGDPNDTTPTMINDIKVSITRNLRTALGMFFNTTPDVYVWADAVCINQADNAEKRSQIALMSRIYHQAGVVVCHLGGVLSEELRLYLAVNFELQQREQSKEVFWARLRNNFKAQGLSDEMQVSVSTAILVGQREFHELPYFQRMWTFQEALIPGRRAMFYIGDDLLEFYDPRNYQLISRPDYIEEASVKLINTPRSQMTRVQHDTYALLDVSGLPKFNQIYFHDMLRLSQLETKRHLSTGYCSPTFEMHKLLAISHERLCGEPRDKIFAVLALLPDFPDDFTSAAAAHAARKRYLDIDYDKSIELVVRDALFYVHHFEKPTALGLLCVGYLPYGVSIHRQRQNERHRHMDGPETRVVENGGCATWVPDMTRPTNKNRINAWKWMEISQMSHGIHWLAADDSRGVGDRLRFTIRVIGRVTQTLTFPTTTDAIIDTVASILGDACLLLEDSPLYRTHHALSKEYGLPMLVTPPYTSQYRQEIRNFVWNIKVPQTTQNERREPMDSVHDRLSAALFS